MNCTGFRVLAVSAALLFGCTARASVQTATPKGPGAQRPSGSGAIATAAPAAKSVTEAFTRANQASGTALTVPGRYTQVLNSRFLNGLPEKRQDINLVEVPLKEALKRVLEDSKTPYVIDDDVPNEPKISIKLTNAPLTTILDALTLSNNIGWRAEFKRSKTTESTAKPAVSANKSLNGSTASATYYQVVTAGDTFVTQIHVGKTVSSLPNSISLRTLNIEGPPVTAAPDALRGAFPPPTPQLRVYRWQSQKRTFTCPRCHNNISILHQPEEVKCTKCQRHFEDNWKVCPIDGTKRPEPKDKWRFCPICGKSITVETSWSAPSPVLDFYRLSLPEALEVEQTYTGAPSSPHYLPGLMEDVLENQHDTAPVPDEVVPDVLVPVTRPIPNPELLLTQ